MLSLMVDGRGVVTLLSNWYGAVTISAQGAPCSNHIPPSSSLSTSPNLLPSVDGDVDLGSATGPKLNPIVVGSSFNVPVYLRSDGIVKSFEILLYVDDTKLGVTGCSAGADWSWTSGFVCSTNDPVHVSLR